MTCRTLTRYLYAQHRGLQVPRQNAWRDGGYQVSGRVRAAAEVTVRGRIMITRNAFRIECAGGGSVYPVGVSLLTRGRSSALSTQGSIRLARFRTIRIQWEYGIAEAKKQNDYAHAHTKVERFGIS